MGTAEDALEAKALWQKDKDHFLHPWTHFDTFKREGSLVIREADVHGAIFEGAVLRTAILRETKLDGVDLSRAEGLDTALMPRGYSQAGAAKS